MSPQSQAAASGAVQTVYGSLTHHRAELQALGDAVHESPHNAPPVAPVLYIKPANTFSAFGQTLHLPAGPAQLQARACVGLIYKPNQHVAGIEYVQYAIKTIAFADWQMAVLCDLTLPQSSFYRPPLRFNALDGSLALPQNWMPWSKDGLARERIETWINGECVHRYQTQAWINSAQEQLEAVSEFIAWQVGDVLMLGCPPDAPMVSVGDAVQTRMLGQIFTQTKIDAEEAP